MKTSYCLEVRGDFACFTRPEMKVERVSYDVITPSAARAVFEAILWKPAIRWRILKIEVLRPIRWINLRRNEVGALASPRKDGIEIDEERQQRAGLFLRDVAYRLHADFIMDRDPTQHRGQFPHLSKFSGEETNTPAKFHEMFLRRAEKGQCINQPYLGCREFACDFRLVRPGENGPPAIQESRDLGWMLYDMDFSNPADPKPTFFRAEMKSGVIDLTNAEVRG
ncbi:MAG: type I-C CRISPR-associated protein Cas5c [Rhodocyclaceae bacterium]|nr:type I-C CRISPR-associated protein Cas5c [Rhodocyclaceae bacterium]